MAFRNFRAKYFLRVVLLCLSVFGVFYLIANTEYYATIVLAAGVTIYQVYSLLKFVEKTNLELSRFLEAIRHSDFSQSFSGAGAGSGFEQLRLNFNEVFDAFRTQRMASCVGKQGVAGLSVALTEPCP